MEDRGSYVRVSGVWKQAEPWVCNQGVWNEQFRGGYFVDVWARMLVDHIRFDSRIWWSLGISAEQGHEEECDKRVF